MGLLLILSEGTKSVLEMCVGISAIAAAFISLSAYRHTRNSENAKQSDIIELKQNVNLKAEKSYVDQQDRSIHHRINDIDKAKADKSLVESMDKKLDLILQKISK